MMPAKSDSLSPAISVIMPVYNGDNYLREALDSILGQTFENFELIIVDDGSNDGSSEIITSYRDPRIKVIRNPLNLGLVEALNVAIQSSVGRYIARHDCDDISHPDRLSMQYLIMEEMQADICGTGWVTMSSEGSILQEQQNPVNEDAIFACLAANVPFPHGSVMMRSSFMRKHHLHYENRIY